MRADLLQQSFYCLQFVRVYVILRVQKLAPAFRVQLPFVSNSQGGFDNVGTALEAPKLLGRRLRVKGFGSEVVNPLPCYGHVTNSSEHYLQEDVQKIITDVSRRSGYCHFS